MANARGAGVAGGVVLLLLWGGIGLFFGKGKSKQKGNKGAVTRRVEPVSVRARRVVPPSRPAKPATHRLTQAPPRRVATQKNPHRFTFVLRLTFIHPVGADGKMSEKTISLKQLIALGRQAKAAKQELHLRIRGDARAKWLNRLKHKLRSSQVAFSVSNDF